MIGASIALKEGEKERCDTLTHTGIIERCRDNITFSQAETGLNKVLCAKISDESLQLQCSTSVDSMNLSLRTNSGTVDAAFCETLGGELQVRCMSRVDRSSDNTLYREALQKKILVNCDSITDDILKTQCRDALFFDQAIREKNITLCESIVDTSRMSYCQKSLEVRSDADFYSSVVAAGDIRECEKLRAENLRRQCHDVIIINEVRST